MNLYVSNCIKFIVLQFVKNVSDHPENYGRNINVRMSFVKFYQFMINKKKCQRAIIALLNSFTVTSF